MSVLKDEFGKAISKHPALQKNLDRAQLIEKSVSEGEAFVSKTGALATWNSPKSTKK